ncbi:MAG: translocation/assembly module TamB domain-containing protein [Flavobacteriales bacterium]
MFQKIKKIFLYLIFFILGLFLVLSILLSMSWFQNYLTQFGSQFLKDHYQVESQIGEVDIDFPDKIVLKDLLIFDHRADTLISASVLKIGLLSPKTLLSHTQIRQLSAEGLDFRIAQYPEDSLTTIQIFANAFIDKNDSSSSSNYQLSISNLDIENSAMKLYNTSDSLTFSLKSLEIDDFFYSSERIFAHIDPSSIELLSRFDAQEVSGDLELIDLKSIDLSDLIIKSGTSELKAQAKVEFDTTDFDWLDLKTKYRLDVERLVYRKKDINFDIINQFLPYDAELKGQLEGSSRKLKFNALDLNLNRSLARLSGYIKHPFNKEKIHLKFDFDQLYVRKNVAMFYLKDIESAEQISRLFPINYSGLYKGNFKYNESKGSFRTALGDVTTDLQILLENEATNGIYFADIEVDEFEFDQLFDSPDFGTSSLKLNIDGEGFRFEDLKVDLESDIEKFIYKGYEYTDIQANGKMAFNQYQGHLEAVDSNINVIFDGLIDLRPERENLDFKAKLKHANLKNLNLYDQDLRLAMDASVNLKGTDIDKANGKLKLTNIEISSDTVQQTLDSIYVESEFISDENRRLSIQSDAVEALAEGQFKMLELSAHLASLMKPYLDFGQDSISLNNQQLEANILLKKPEILTEIWMPECQIAQHSTIHLDKKSVDLPMVTAFFPRLTYNNFEASELNIKTEGGKEDLRILIDADSLKTEFSALKINQIKLVNELKDNALSSRLLWVADFENTDYSGDVSFSTQLDSSLNIASTIENQSILYMADAAWQFRANNSILYQDNELVISDLILEHQDQTLSLDLLYQLQNKQELKTHLHQFNMAYLNPYIQEFNTSISGLVNGDLNISNLSKSTLFFTGNLSIDSTKLNGVYLGKSLINSSFSTENKLNTVDIKVVRSGFTPLHALLAYNTSKGFESFTLDAKINKLRLDYFTPYIDTWVTDLRGRVSGDVLVDQQTANGTLTLEKVGFSLPVVGTRYNIEGKPLLEVNKRYIDIPEFKLNVVKLKGDPSTYGQAIAKGKIYHKNFLDYRYDLAIDFRDFLCMSTNYSEESIFYGDAIASGKLKMTGNNKSPNIIIDASAKKGTELTLSYSDQTEISDDSFIRFRQKDSQNKLKTPKRMSKDDDLSVDLNLKVDPSALMNFNVDESALTGRGYGDLNFKFDSNLDFDLYGSYVVDEADYMFAFTDVLEAKKFNIDKGGRVDWKGDALKGIMDIKAEYSTKMMIDVLDESEYQKQEVKSIIELDGELLQPSVGFKIEMPNASDAAKSKLDEITSSEEKMVKQFLSLLIMNSFYIQEEGIITDRSPENQLLFSGANALISSQLNKWLNETQDQFDIGVKLNPGTGDELSSQELEVYLGKNFLNDRLRLNGNIGTPLGTNTSGIKGDFNLEYDLRRDGKLRLKVFNAAGETLSHDIENTQGIGVFYRVEFDHLFNTNKGKTLTN